MLATHLFVPIRTDSKLTLPPTYPLCQLQLFPIGTPKILGIGGFTYVLGALIVLMLTLNAVLGPGWLGQAMGIQGTGTFTEVSSSLPDQIDLSADAYLL